MSGQELIDTPHGPLPKGLPMEDESGIIFRLREYDSEHTAPWRGRYIDEYFFKARVIPELAEQYPQARCWG